MTGPFRGGTLTLYRFRVIFVAATLALAACSSDSEIAARKAAEASALLDAGNIYGARIAAQASVNARDDISANWILLGRVQLAAGQIGEAYVSYTRALELDATNVEAMQLVADIALQVGRFRDADKMADQLLALQPDLVRAKLVKGFVALNDNKLDVAGRYADDILSRSPTDDGGIVLKARALAKQDKFEESIKLLQTQMIVSEAEIVISTLAEVQRAAHDGQGLATTLTKLVEKNPNDNRIFDLASVLYKIGKPQDARALVFKRLEENKDRPDYFDDVTAFLIVADPGAIDAAHVAQIASSGTPRMRELAARVLLASGRAPEARRVLEPVAGSTTDPDLKALYATALVETGAGSQAPAIIADVIKADENNVDALQLRAQLALARGDEKAALADAGLVARNAPLAIGGRMVMITTYLKRDDMRRARQLFEEALRAMPKSLEIRERYLRFLAAQRDQERAFQVMSAYTDLNPARVRGWDILNSVCGDVICRQRASVGRTNALKLFPADEFAGKKPTPGLFGPL